MCHHLRPKLCITIAISNQPPTVPSRYSSRLLFNARVVLEYDQLCDHYNICFARLQALNRDIETLRRENSDLLVANNELMKLLNLSSMAVMNNRNLQRKELPKSVSVRSSNYLKLNHQQGPRNQQQVVNPLVS
ncbi:hypothetical protein GOBAR_AA12537 [Gossypium barbadense]|uniref:Uncharacterized protein n=1 Tax=Gossypium barbadense TaxID=3634 RepID=A0A2P5XXN0_GOSBA|nr:hypothetical protein GOBAR_AA12537 [Gossypium barbadense]